MLSDLLDTGGIFVAACSSALGSLIAGSLSWRGSPCPACAPEVHCPAEPTALATTCVCECGNQSSAARCPVVDCRCPSASWWPLLIAFWLGCLVGGLLLLCGLKCWACVRPAPVQVIQPTASLSIRPTRRPGAAALLDSPARSPTSSEPSTPRPRAALVAVEEAAVWKPRGRNQ